MIFSEGIIILALTMIEGIIVNIEAIVRGGVATIDIRIGTSGGTMIMEIKGDTTTREDITTREDMIIKMDMAIKEDMITRGEIITKEDTITKVDTIIKGVIKGDTIIKIMETRADMTTEEEITTKEAMTIKGDTTIKETKIDTTIKGDTEIRMIIIKAITIEGNTITITGVAIINHSTIKETLILSMTTTGIMMTSSTDSKTDDIQTISTAIGTISGSSSSTTTIIEGLILIITPGQTDRLLTIIMQTGPGTLTIGEITSKIMRGIFLRTMLSQLHPQKSRTGCTSLININPKASSQIYNPTLILL